MPTEGKDSPEKVSDIRFHSNMLILHNSIHKKESSPPTRYLSWRQRTYFGNGRQPPGDSQVRMHFYYFRANNHLSHLRQYWRDAFSFIHHANMLKSCAGRVFLSLHIRPCCKHSPLVCRWRFSAAVPESKKTTSAVWTATV